MPSGTRAPKELLHHLSALALRRRSVSACAPGRGRGMRGSRLLDRRPPHYRCPAVPGFTTSTRAILMAWGSSVLPSVINYLLNGGLRTAGTALLLRTAVMRTTSGLLQRHSRQPAPSPILLLLWLGTPLPSYPVRAPAADAFTGVLLTDFTAGYSGYCHCVYCGTAPRRPLITAGHPVRSSAPSPSCKNVASELHHRTVLRTAPSRTASRQFVSAGPCCPSGLREKP